MFALVPSKMYWFVGFSRNSVGSKVATIQILNSACLSIVISDGILLLDYSDEYVIK